MTSMVAVADQSVDAVFSSHNIEHLYPHEIPLAVAEFLRVLKMDGFAVITCPDLQSVAVLVAQDKLTEPAYVSPAGPLRRWTFFTVTARQWRRAISSWLIGPDSPKGCCAIRCSAVVSRRLQADAVRPRSILGGGCEERNAGRETAGTGDGTYSVIDGAPAAIRTRDLRLRRPTLYPAELQARGLGVAIVPAAGKRRPELAHSAASAAACNLRTVAQLRVVKLLPALRANT